MNTKLDERQLINRYKIGLQSFLLVMSLLLLDLIIQDIFGFVWASHFNRTMILFCIVSAFFTIRCIFTDSYFAERDRYGDWIIIAIFILNGISSVAGLIFAAKRGDLSLLENGQLSDQSGTLATALLMFSISLCYFLKRWYDRKEEA